MGNLKDLMGMIPGVGKQIKDLDVNDDAFKGIEAMINSMTLEERRNPDIIKPQPAKHASPKVRVKTSPNSARLPQAVQMMKSMMKMMEQDAHGPLSRA